MSEQNRARIGQNRSAWPDLGRARGVSRCVGHGEAGVRARNSAVRAKIRSSLSSSPSSPVALLFILLLTMVIMALLPKAVDLEERKDTPSQPASPKGRGPLLITTPPRLPEAVAGRPYLVALAATGGSGPAEWSAEGELPDWLSLDRETGRIGGVPPAETKKPLEFEVRVSDGSDTACARRRAGRAALSI